MVKLFANSAKRLDCAAFRRFLSAREALNQKREEFLSRRTEDEWGRIRGSCYTNFTNLHEKEKAGEAGFRFNFRSKASLVPFLFLCAFAFESACSTKRRRDGKTREERGTKEKIFTTDDRRARRPRQKKFGVRRSRRLVPVLGLEILKAVQPNLFSSSCTAITPNCFQATMISHELRTAFIGQRSRIKRKRRKAAQSKRFANFGALT